MQKNIYNKLMDFLKREGFEISSEQGIPDTAMYSTHWKGNTRIQFNVNFVMSPPKILRKKR